MTMVFEPLGNLTEQSARVGVWLLRVATAPRIEEYRWTKGNTTNTGKVSGEHGLPRQSHSSHIGVKQFIPQSHSSHTGSERVLRGL